MGKLKMSGLITGGLAVALSMTVPGHAQEPRPRPDFSGTWVFDQEGTDGAATPTRVATNIFGASFVAHQDAKTLTFDITVAAGTVVKASYALDGTETKNVSPPQVPGAEPIVVTAKSKWVGDQLLIESRSQQPATGYGGEAMVIDVVSTRTIWLGATGKLVIDRDGTPKQVVQSTRSVYKRQ